MKRFLSALLAVLLLSGPAFSQAVQQSGTVTPGHIPSWVTSGVIKDAGSATSASITEFGVTKNGGLPFCVNSANTGALNRLCLTSTTNSGAKLTVTDQGGATDGTLTIDINGNSVVLPAAPGGTVLPTVQTTPAIADSAPTCFSGTDGTLKSCGGTPGTGTVTSVAAGTGLTASPSQITTTGTISLANTASGTVLGNSSGGSTAPTAQTVGGALSLSSNTLNLADIASGTLLGNSTGGASTPSAQTVGSGLSLSAGTLSVSGITASSLGAGALSGPVNFAFTASVAANELTIAVKTQAGADPSVGDPVKIPFQDQSGGYSALSLTGATSFTLTSGSTLGTTNAVLYRIWVVGFNDSSTFRLCAINTQTTSGIVPIMPDLSNSATAEDGAGGADSAGVIYCNATVSSKPMVVLGYLETTQATAGTWATSPSKAIIWQKGMKLPGDTVQVQQVVKTDTFASTSATYEDITGASVSITPRSAANRVWVNSSGSFSNSSGGDGTHVSLLRNSTQILLGDPQSSRVQATVSTSGTAAAFGLFPFSISYLDSPAATSATTYKLQIRRGAAGTATIGRSGTDPDTATSGRVPLVIVVTEIMS